VRFRSDPSTLRGSIAPVVTPFTDDGQLDTEGLRRLISWQLDSGSHGISLGGSTGEPSAQTTQERIAAMTGAARVIADRVPFLPGTGSARLDETLELTAAAAGLGADAALVITPTSHPRPSPGCGGGMTTSSGSRRPPGTSSTSPACCTSAAATPWCGRASSCCACRCSPSAGSAS
jgi:hypothetical protein